MKKHFAPVLPSFFICIALFALQPSNAQKNDASSQPQAPQNVGMIKPESNTRVDSSSTTRDLQPKQPALVQTNIVVSDTAQATTGSNANKPPLQAVTAVPTPVPTPVPQAQRRTEPTASSATPRALTNLNQPLSSRTKREGLYVITSDDETLYLALRRWTDEGGYQIVWDAGKDFPARKTSYQAKDIEDAIGMVMRDTARSSYPLHACAYSNKVIRVLHVSQSCERSASSAPSP